MALAIAPRNSMEDCRWQLSFAMSFDGWHLLWELNLFMPKNTFECEANFANFLSQPFLASGLGNCPLQFCGIVLAICFGNCSSLVGVQTAYHSYAFGGRAELSHVPFRNSSWQVALATVVRHSMANCRWQLLLPILATVLGIFPSQLFLAVAFDNKANVFGKRTNLSPHPTP